MNKKDNKRQKKKDKRRKVHTKDIPANTEELIQRIKELESELKQREKTIQTLTRQLNESKTRKKKKSKSGATNNLFAQQTTQVAIAQRKAWKRHGYLRDRYEFHLSKNQDKINARMLADRDLREQFGEDAGYSEYELEQILS